MAGYVEESACFPDQEELQLVVVTSRAPATVVLGGLSSGRASEMASIDLRTSRKPPCFSDARLPSWAGTTIQQSPHRPLRGLHLI